MSLSARLARHVSASVRIRGEQYDAERRVKLVGGSPTSVLARVRGTQIYVVSIELQGTELVASCGCPYADADLCKHIWATLRAAERAGHLSMAARYGPLTLSLRVEGDDDAEGSDDDLDDDEPGDEESDDDPGDDPHSGDHRALASNGAARHLSSFRPALPPSAPRGQVAPFPAKNPPTTQRPWETLLFDARSSTQRARAGREQWAARDIAYVLETVGPANAAHVRIHTLERSKAATGKWKPLVLPESGIPHLSDEADRLVLGLLGSRRDTRMYGGYGATYEQLVPANIELPLASAASIVVAILQTGRAYLEPPPDPGASPDAPAPAPIAFEEGDSWVPCIDVDPRSGGGVELRGSFRRGDETIDVVTPDLVVPGGVFVARGRAARFEDRGVFGWVAALRAQGVVAAPAADIEPLMATLFAIPAPLRIELSPDLGFAKATATPTMYAIFRSPHQTAESGFRVDAGADYSGARAAFADPSRYAIDVAGRKIIGRDLDAERQARAFLSELGARPLSTYGWGNAKPEHRIATGRFLAAARALVAAGWHVEADGKAQRSATDFRIEVVSGIDWFDVSLKADFGGVSASMGKLLASLRAGATTIVLDDGSVGIIPEEWLRRWGLAISAGALVDGHLRFRRGHAAMLDVLLAERPEAHCDEAFTALRRQIASFATIEPLDAPRGFVGTLRDYQRDGLGWMKFLRDTRLGGCLADDMGLGKTIQVLAMLLARRHDGRPKRPTLIVVPRSLMFNWRDEATRFTPGLTVLEHIGLDRTTTSEHLARYDMVLTTYGTLRRDAEELARIEFDYVILDEATAIKTASSAAAKAARLLRAEHRLALTGTPIENHLGELWSLFEFLNPGMLGSASVFRQVSGVRGEPSEHTRDLLRRVLRPFILRRTKRQVAKELPERVEQTLYCDLERHERGFYDELRDHVRASLRRRVTRDGIARSTVHILEGLLRMRQAACHPALIDKSRGHETSAKLDVLFEHLARVREEGEKAIVFSQFTSLLSLVRRRLDAEGAAYGYLDGRTRDRREVVERFQTDDACRLFLVSLKAGGVGLNLTAAHFVFVLDPWWNPAVEAQAIDRAHRIGQSETVFAYRIIAKNTVEEKVAELQARKRALADAVLGEDAGGLRGLTQSDLELLLA